MVRPTKVVRVAIIGSGLAGLTAAHLLSLQPVIRTRRRISQRDGEDSKGNDGVVEGEEEEEEGDVRLDVHVFEKADQLGMDSSSVSVKLEGGKEVRVDTPMRSIQGGYYKRVLKLYKYLGIQLRKTDFDYSFSRLSSPLSTPSHSHPHRPSLQTTFIYSGSSGLRPDPIGIPSHLIKPSLQILSLISYLLNSVLLALSYLQLLFLSLAFHHLGLTSARSENRCLGQTFEEWCDDWWIWKGLREEVLEPMFACVCTMKREEVRKMPVVEVLDYVALTFGTHHYASSTGVRSIVRSLSRPISPSNIHLGQEGDVASLRPIFSPRPTSSSASTPLTRPAIEIETTTGKRQVFQYVIFATQANQAVSLLKDFTKLLEGSSDVSSGSGSGIDVGSREEMVERERERCDVLSKFEYERTLVVNHLDRAVLVGDKDDWRDLNVGIWEQDPKQSREGDIWEGRDEERKKKLWLEKDYVMATHIISRTNPVLFDNDNAGDGRSAGPGSEPSSEQRLIMQTTNPTIPVDPSKIISATWYERAKVTLGSRRILSRFIVPTSSQPRSKKGADLQLQGLSSIYLCGSWCAPGIPLLEGCVESAEMVFGLLLDDLGVEGRGRERMVPWDNVEVF